MDQVPDKLSVKNAENESGCSSSAQELVHSIYAESCSISRRQRYVNFLLGTPLQHGHDRTGARAEAKGLSGSTQPHRLSI